MILQAIVLMQAGLILEDWQYLDFLADTVPHTLANIMHQLVVVVEQLQIIGSSGNDVSTH